jgi:dynein regulatry complex protein 1
VEIQNCEKCYQDMKALYQLNSEKLSYNYRVLVEKNNENSKLQTDLKAKDADYQDQYKRKSTLYTTSYNNLISINKKLTKSYTLLSKRYKDLHKKYQHFELTDKARYKEIRQMNEEEIQKMKEKIRNCDRIIHQHQLGVVWEAFTDTDIINEELGSLKVTLRRRRRRP